MTIQNLFDVACDESIFASRTDKDVSQIMREHRVSNPPKDVTSYNVISGVVFEVNCGDYPSGGTVPE